MMMMMMMMMVMIMIRNFSFFPARIPVGTSHHIKPPYAVKRTWMRVEPGSIQKICAICQITLTNKKTRRMFCLYSKLKKDTRQAEIYLLKLIRENLGKSVNMFKVKNKDTIPLVLTLFWCPYCELWKYFTSFFSISIATLNMFVVVMSLLLILNAFNLVI